MSDPRGLMDRIRRAGSAVDPALTDGEVERIVGGLPQRRRRRGVGRVGRVLAVAAFATLIVAALRHQVLKQPPDERSSLAAAQVNDEATALGPPLQLQLQLADGSLATPLDASASLVVVENSPARVTLDLHRGRERFQVVPRPSVERSFHVRAGEVTVTVIGTVFTVERVADRIGVWVERGHVRVAWAQGGRSLRAGESGWFPPLAGVDAPDQQAGQQDSQQAGQQDGNEESPPGATEEPPAAAPPSHAQRRATAIAAAQPSSAPGARVVPPRAALDPPSAEQLLRAADTARLAGRAAEAAALLQRLIADRSDDPRAPLAAFTLGRLLMRDLGRPGDAAVAFAQARALAPAGPLAEDALARQAEALGQAGARSDARARAAEYLRLYPRGRRGPALKVLGGPE